MRIIAESRRSIFNTRIVMIGWLVGRLDLSSKEIDVIILVSVYFFVIIFINKYFMFVFFYRELDIFNILITVAIEYKNGNKKLKL